MTENSQENTSVVVFADRPDQRLITKHNDLINAQFSLTLKEEYLLLSCIAKIDSRNDVPDSVTMYAHEYKALFSSSNPYRDMREGADRLFEREIMVVSSDQQKTERMRFVQKVDYDKGNGSATLYFSNAIKPLIGNITGNHTSWRLMFLPCFNSCYSSRLYELLAQRKDFKQRVFLLSDLKSMFELTDKYKVFADFRKFVIEPAMKEINLHTDLDVTCTYVRRGRSVHSLDFSISTSKQKSFLF